MTAALDDRHAVLLTDLNWQMQNGLSYFTRAVTPGDRGTLGCRTCCSTHQRWFTTIDGTGATSWSTERARRRTDRRVRTADLASKRTRGSSSIPLAAIARRVPAGTRYVLCVLRPSRDLPLDAGRGRRRAARALGAAGRSRGPSATTRVVAGVAGRRAGACRSPSDRPFRRDRARWRAVDIRMESWLAADTIRRMGFGQVVAARQHTLIVERGLSFVAFDDRGEPLRYRLRGEYVRAAAAVPHP